MEINSNGFPLKIGSYEYIKGGKRGGILGAQNYFGAVAFRSFSGMPHRQWSGREKAIKERRKLKS